MKRKIICLTFLIILAVTGCKNSKLEEKEKVSVKPLVIDVEQPITAEISNESENTTDLFTENIMEIFDDYNNGNISIYVKELSEGNVCVLESRKMEAASLIKVYIAGSVYENYEDVCEYIGDSDAVEELVRKMISESDNDASNKLTIALGNGSDIGGRNIVNDFCESHGYSDTHMGRMLLESNEFDDNYTSVSDCGKALEDIYNNQLCDSEKILNYMKQQERVSKIPAGIPDGIASANKTGELSDVENDIAIIFSINHPYIICIMSDGLSDTYSARQSETEISRRIYSYICGE